jgi:hypothetical protein
MAGTPLPLRGGGGEAGADTGTRAKVTAAAETEAKSKTRRPPSGGQGPTRQRARGGPGNSELPGGHRRRRHEAQRSERTRGTLGLGATRGTPTAKARSTAEERSTVHRAAQRGGGGDGSGERASSGSRGAHSANPPGGGASAITMKLGGELHNQCESRQHRIGRRTPRHRRKSGEGADDHGEERTPRRGQAPLFLPRRSACT